MIDLEHLKKQTMDDRDLALELLGLFARQLEVKRGELAASKDEGQIRMLAHSLKGAARNVGAFALADLAEGVELDGGDQVALLVSEVGKCVDHIPRVVSLLCSET